VRFAEIALFAVPFVVFVVWRLLAPSAGPPKVLVVAVTATVVAMAGLLLGLWYEDAEPPGVGYVPAQLQDGRILPERVVPIVPRQPASPSLGQASPAGPAQTDPAQRDPAQTDPAQTGPSSVGPSSAVPSPAGPPQK
jgi:hypothetical protein